MENRFDKVAIAIAGGLSSRRTALKWLSGILPATFFAGALGERKAFADDDNNNNGDDDVKQRCHDFCKDVLRHQRDQCLDACEHCKGKITGLCGTPGSMVCCSTGTVCCHSVNACGTTVAVCTNTNMDPNNCGTCGNVCVSGTCVNGQCVSNCAPNLTTCAGICTDTSKDVHNCGGCGILCASGQLCTNGVCTCPSGMTLCSSSTGAQACVNTQTDPGNCGACSNVCPAGQSCVGGSCTAVTCPPNQVRCGTATVCCPGTACCGSICPTAHFNGMGQTYYDCYPDGVPGNPNTYNQTMAFDACLAAVSAGTPGSCSTVSGCGTNGAVALQSPAQCIVWVYSGPTAGYVSHSPPLNGNCFCPGATDLVWN